MKKYIITLLVILLVPTFVYAGGSSDDSTSEPIICVYNDSRINAYIRLYESGKVTGEGFFVLNGQESGRYRDAVEIGNDYTSTTECPEYVLVTYGKIGVKQAPFYASNSRTELENIIKNNGFIQVDFSEKESINADTVGSNVWVEIFSLTSETQKPEEETKKCTYTDIIGCNDCEVTIEFWTSGSYIDIGDSVVKSYSKSSNISSVSFKEDIDWQKKKISGWTTTPFSNYLTKNLCPEGIYMYYDSATQKVNAYLNEIKYENDEDKEIVQTPSGSNDYVDKINYNSLCENRSIKQTMKLIGYLVQVVRWIVPLIIIVLGMIDFGKASIESDDKALNKATASLIRRIVAGVVVFFIPTIILGLLNAIEITKGIEDETNSQFGACTKCIFGAHKSGYCDISAE